MIRGQVYLAETGLLGASIVNVENACAASSSAFSLASAAVGTGEADVAIAIAIGAEKLVVPEKGRAFAALASATDLARRPEMRELVWDLASGAARIR